MSDSSSSTSSTLGTIGAILAAFMSYAKWHSFWWCVAHFFCGWFYVIYYLFTYGVPKLPQ